MSLSEIFKETFNEDITEMSDDTAFSSLSEWDSMSHMLFITKVEETFGIELSADDIAEITTVGAIKNVLQEKGKAA